MKTKEDLTLVALQMGMAVPFLYFGTQLVTAPFFPGYSCLTMPASLLGSDQAVYPAIFNVGAIITGIATLIASVGFLYALQELKANPILAWLTTIAIALNGLGQPLGGIYPTAGPKTRFQPVCSGHIPVTSPFGCHPVETKRRSRPKDLSCH